MVFFYWYVIMGLMKKKLIILGLLFSLSIVGCSTSDDSVDSESSIVENDEVVPVKSVSLDRSSLKI